MFEDYTYEAIMADAIAAAPEGIDTREGSIYWDAVSGMSLRIAKYYSDLDLVLSMSTLMTATGDALDEKAAEHGVSRMPAMPAEYRASFEGAAPKLGERFYYDLAYFYLAEARDGDGTALIFRAEQEGEAGNGILPGTPAVPVNSIPGLTAATFGEAFSHGSDEEGDESLRRRTMEKIAGPAENGNRQHYKTWCESRPGVGQARIFPLWQGENTVKAVLVDPDGKPCTQHVVDDVQAYVDPAGKGMEYDIGGKKYPKGDGLGNGVANIGAHFTAVAATELPVTVAFTATPAEGNDAAKVIEEATPAIEEYLRGLVMDAGEGGRAVVRINAIGAILVGLKSLDDYDGLTLNGSDGNVTAGEDEVPVLKGVEAT